MAIVVDSSDQILSQRIPFLVRVVSIFILVEGVVGFLFYVTSGVFQFTNTHFIGNLGLNNLSRNFYSFYIILHIAIYAGFIYSGVFLLRLKKSAYYLFITNYLILMVLGVIVNDTFSWTAIVVGFCLFVVLLYYHKKMI